MCRITDPSGCAGQVVDQIAGGATGLAADTAGGLADGLGGGLVDGLVGGAVSSGWEAICRAWGQAATVMLEGFARAFSAAPTLNPHDPAIRAVYGLSLSIAVVVAAGLFLVQVTRTVLAHEGSALAHGLTGLARAIVAVAVTLGVSAAGLTASNQLTHWIISRTFEDTGGLQKKITTLFSFQQPSMTPTLILIFSVAGILLVLVLWAELLLAGAAVAVLVATAPIAAAGQVSDLTSSWWPKLVSATVHLLILKPVIALVFALGLTLAGSANTATAPPAATTATAATAAATAAATGAATAAATGAGALPPGSEGLTSPATASQMIGTQLAGLLILLLAALAWPAIARFFTFTTVRVGGGAGLAAVLGTTSNRMNGSTSTGMPFTGPGAGSGAGADAGPAGTGDAGPNTAFGLDQFARAGHVRTHRAVGGGAGGLGGGGAHGAASAGAAGGVLAVLDLAQRAANSVVGRMEQTAGHAGLDGANPHPYVAGFPSYYPSRAHTGDDPGYHPESHPGDQPGESYPPNIPSWPDAQHLPHGSDAAGGPPPARPVGGSWPTAP